MTTPRFAELTHAFAPGLLNKIHALKTLDLNKHQAARLREAVSIDVRKLCDILVPQARHPEVSVTAADRAEAIGVDLRQETWQSQTRFDPKRLVFHYEHMNPVQQIVASLMSTKTPDEVIEVIDDGLRLAWITKEEDLRLTALGYRNKRPDPADAYTKTGIILIPCLSDPSGPVSLAPTPLPDDFGVKSESPAPNNQFRFLWTPDQITITPPSSPEVPVPSDGGGVDGDLPVWRRHLPLAWTAGAGYAPEAPPDPTPALIGEDSHADELVAYWAPLLHLLVWGLGWQRPDGGLAAWRAQGYPTSNRVLALVHRWWGPERVLDFLAWTTYSDALLDFVPAQQSGRPQIDQTLTASLESDPEIVARRRDRGWMKRWEQYDPFGMVKHAKSPIESPRVFNPLPFLSHHGSVVVVADDYAGWAKILPHYAPMISDASTGIDVFCRDVGWLGHYRRSTRTGRWFREDELTHFMGN